MNTLILKHFILLAALITVHLYSFNLMAQEPNHTFNYQGQLVDDGSPANGSYDIKISPFFNEMGGIVFGKSSEHLGTLIDNGLFSINNVDIVDPNGTNPLDGGSLYLEIAIKKTNSNQYTVLSGRQLIQAVPYANTLTRNGANDGQVLTYNEGTNEWLPENPTASPDNQNIENFNLNGTVLSLGIQRGNSQNVNLAGLQDGIGTDDQVLMLSDNKLIIEGGNTVLFTDWDTNVNDDFNGDYTDLINLPTLPWSSNNNGISYTGGSNTISINNPTADFLIDTAFDGNNLFQIRRDNVTKFTVDNNGGTVIGSNTVPPAGGLFVQEHTILSGNLEVNGDTKQSADSNGMVKYMVGVGCGIQELLFTSFIFRQYNATKTAGAVEIDSDGDALGSCVLTFPTEINNRFWHVSALESGINIGAHCDASVGLENTQLRCYRFNTATDLSESGGLMVIVY